MLALRFAPIRRLAVQLHLVPREGTRDSEAFQAFHGRGRGEVSSPVSTEMARRAIAGSCGFGGFERVAHLSNEEPTRSRSWRTGERHADAEGTGRRSRFTSSERGERAACARRVGA